MKGLAFLSAVLPVAMAAFHWPDPKMDHLDSMLYDDSGILDLFVANCGERDNTTTSAQWVRIAYHDMSTHNVDDGSGGLDASIAFELDNPQNIGLGMARSVQEFASHIVTPQISLADVIAAGLVFGVAGCGGPVVPFRGGRIDATSAGPSLVPEPHEDLASHTESFRRQGFTQSEMISLVACGHSLGGVRQSDFPTILHDPVVNEIVEFDGTKPFDNAVITGYLDNTTPNPLVVGKNSTTNSDLRIFSSDRNATMQSMASPDSFSQTCSALFERMINTVPKGVQLTDVVEPLEYKVGQTNLFPGASGDGTFRFTTSLRMLKENPQRTVTLFWKDRQGSACPAEGCSATPTNSFAFYSMLGRARGLTRTPLYEFDAKINMSSSISKFWFKVDEGDGSAPVLLDNEGAGLPIEQDDLLFDRARSTREPQGFATHFNTVVAVRTNDPATKVSLSLFTYGDLTSPLAKWTTVDCPVDPSFPPVGGYTFFSVRVPIPQPSGRQWMEIVAEVGGRTIREKNMRILSL